MAFLGDLLIRMRAETGDFQSDMGKAAYMAEKSMKQIERAAGKLGIALGAGAFGMYLKGLVDSAEQMSKMSERTGIGVAQLSELKFAAALGEVEIGQLAKKVGFFNIKTVEAGNSASVTGKMFKELGVDVTKGPNEALLQFAKRASAIEDAAVKTAVFRAALGKTGDELIPVFKNLEETTNQARRLGAVMSEETAGAAARLNDNMKALKIQTDAWTTKAMDPIVSAFVTITDSITKAAEKGEKWLQILKEILKLSAAAAASTKDLPGILGLPGRAWDAAAGKLFENPTLRPGEVAGKIGNLSAKTDKKPDSKALGKILSGADSKAAIKESDAVWRALQEGEEQWQKDFTEAWKVYSDITNKTFNETTEAHAKSMQQWFDDIDQEQEVAIAAGKAYLDALGDSANKANEIGKELGLTFSSAFEDAIVNGKKFQDVLKGILQDVLRIAARRAITEPLEKNISSIFSGLNFGKMFGAGGGGWTAGGDLPMGSFATGTDYVPRTGMYQLHKGEGVVTAAENGKSGNITFSPVINIDSRTDSATIARTVDGAMRQSEARLIEQLNRGQGGISQAVRRT